MASDSSSSSSSNRDKKGPSIQVDEISNASSRTLSVASSRLSVMTPRHARFTEATSVNSPIDPPRETSFGATIVPSPSSSSSSSSSSSPDSDSPRSPGRERKALGLAPIKTQHVLPEPQVADVGFGYLGNTMDSTALKHTSIEVPLTPAGPLKSALRTPAGATLKPPQTPHSVKMSLKSPTFREERRLAQEEKVTEKKNAQDVAVKKRVRIAKFFLRGVNFSCSLIILSMMSMTMTIFNTTKMLPTRNNLPAWATGQSTWPQTALLVIACVSLAVCVLIFYAYWKGGHRKARRTAMWYTIFGIGVSLFSTVMWVLAAAMLHSSRSNGNGQDMWGWSCADNKRSSLFQDEVNYTLICRLQNWSLICVVIEIIVEALSITIYIVVISRFFSKRRLAKSMDRRDRARSNLYSAQLRHQSAPNTPGFGVGLAPPAPHLGANGLPSIRSPLGMVFPPTMHDSDSDSDVSSDPDGIDAAEKGRWASADAADADYARRAEAFHASHGPAGIPHPLQQHAVTSTTTTAADELSALGMAPVPPTPMQETVHDHAPVAPGERHFAAVPIPGAYASPVASPAFAPADLHLPSPHLPRYA